ncbi:LuxR C-terminal-related transcriptional regulator [Herbiconiux moechotypicola]|uniref:LuxR C-terminal-related transcriptional regulator n=1 Tax=Herbiconiux moechotypicola TaxID=637393 RepID=A0ABN3D975_9MICO|nr:LuxR C-terminal-related transcriptional regulator [Herbiconiux moechotypicola]MCS5729111.1 LuxR C-terminal-related transcriptional regulator [Herbiconiux moechotypicola]
MVGSERASGRPAHIVAVPSPAAGPQPGESLGGILESGTAHPRLDRLGARIAGAPRLPRLLVDRPRLTSLLDSPSPLVVVQGMGGAGKTVLLADWARRVPPEGGAPQNGAWVPIRRRHPSRQSFWAEVGQGLLDAGIVGAGSPAAELGVALGSSTDPRSTIVRAFAAVDQGVHLVIDNYERVVDTEVHLDLIELLEFDERMRVTLATRSISRLEHDLASLRVDTDVIPAAALRFTEAEIAEFLTLGGASPAAASSSGALVDSIQHTTGGLALPVRAAVTAYLAGGDVIGPASVRLPQALIGYVASTVEGESEGDGFREFLTRIAVPEGVTAELAETLSNDPAVRQHLAVAEARGLGLWSTEEGERVFHLSAVVRAALRDEIAAQAPAHLAELRRRYAIWADEHGRPLTALRAAVEGGDLELASHIVLRDWAVLVESELAATVEVLSVLPLGRIRQQPLLAMMLGIGLTTLGESAMRAIDLFTLAIAASRVRGSRSGSVERFVLLVGESTAYRLTGRFEQAGRSAEQALRLYDELAPADRDELSRNAHVHLGQLGLSMLYWGDGARALEAFSSAYASASHLPQQRARMHPLSLMAGTLAISGDLARAEELVRRLDAAHWPDGWRSGYIGAYYHLARGLLAVQAFDFDEATRQLAAVDGARSSEHRAVFLLLQGQIDLGTGRHRAGSIELELELDATRTPEFARVHADALRGVLAIEFIASGRTAKAESVLAAGSIDAPIICLARALIALLADDASEALRLLNGIKHRPGASQHIGAALSWARAAVFLRLGSEEVAIDIAIETVALVERLGLPFSVLFLPRVDRDALLELASRRGVHEVVDFFASVSERPSFLPDSLERVRLTERESAVLVQLLDTGSAAEIASALFVSVNTVKSQLRSLYRKLNVTSREEALIAAAELGLLAG